jgi:hypothetical protein
LQQRYSEFAEFPDLLSKTTSLSAMEKSLLGHYILLLRPRVILELGVFEAVTTRFICEFLRLNQIEAKVYSFDLPDVIAKLRAENSIVQELEASGQLELRAGFLPDALIAWQKEHHEKVDLAIVDAGHTYWHVAQELRLLWQSLAANGYIICDDYSPKYRGICFAVDSFARKKDVQMLALVAEASADNHQANLAVLRKAPYQYGFWQKLRFYSETIRRWPLVAPLWQWLRTKRRSKQST